MDAPNWTAQARSFLAALRPNAVSPSGAPPNTLAITAPRPFMAVGVPAVSDRISINRVGGKIGRFADRRAPAAPLPVHQQRQIDSKFHGRTRTELANMFDTAAHLFENWRRPGDVPFRAADEAK